MITTFKLVESQTLWIMQERCQRPFGNSACDAYMFYYLASIFIVLNVINQNVDHFSLLFSLFFFKLVTVLKSVVQMSLKFARADIELVSRR